MKKGGLISQRVELKFDKYYFILTISGQLPLKNLGSNIFQFCGYRSQRTFRKILTRIFKCDWFSWYHSYTF